MIPQEDINKVLEANDLVQIVADVVPDIKQRGGKFIACCPFHKEKTPSFQVDPNLQLWHCFGCGEGGNLVTFVQKYYDMNFVEAMQFLAEKVNIQLRNTGGGKAYSKSQKGRLMQICDEAAKFYHMQLMRSKNAGANSARRYLGSRNMGSDVSKKWLLGYAPGNDLLVKHLVNNKFAPKDIIDANLGVKGRDGRIHDRFFNRVMFPIRDVRGDFIAFGGRIIGDGQPKYLNSNENALFHKSQVLYGLDIAKQYMTASGCAIVVEGYTDVIALHEAGFKYAVATLGTALTKQHIRILNQHAKQKIVYLFDGDQAGQRAAERALNFIDQMEQPEVYNKRASLVALTLPDNMDPKEFIDKNGKEALSELLDQSKPLLQYGIERKISKYDLSIPGNKARAAASAVKVLAPIKDSLIAKEYAAIIADLTSMRVEDIIDELNKLKKPTDLDDIYVHDNTENNKSIEKETPIISVSSRTATLENELLCVFARCPQSVFRVMENEDYHWSNSVNENLYNYILSAVKANGGISSKELILHVHTKNPQSANMLTRMSKMYDMKDEPEKHGKFLLYSLIIENLNNDIKTMTFQLKNVKDSEVENQQFEKISELQKEINKYKNLKKGLI